MKRYCCEKFANQLELSREHSLNIRVLKFEPKDLIDTEKRYRFFITPGYTLADRSVPVYNIAYCPFCGKDLFKFYKDDAFVNEDDSSFLYP
ncbi:hypothetical protein ACQKLP_12955 [Chitinophaga sp. NPDC101104]|uniref:hypothetical protein n=1 Tax=Chitinophaga sp. NPDC101104 TaxID=3390561 RepID=UPI003D004ACF